MTKRSMKTRCPSAHRPVGPEVDDAPEPQAGREQSNPCPAPGARESALALHMGLPGTRLDMTLGGPHPLLVDLVRHLARGAARADHASTGIPRATIAPDHLPEDL